MNTGVGTAGNAQGVIAGQASCTMDATASNTRGQFVVASTTTAGQCHSTATQPSGSFVIGTLVSNSTTSASAATESISAGYFPPAGGSGTAALFFQLGADRSGNWILMSANQIRLFGFYLNTALTFSRIMVSMGTTDASANYDFRVYDSGGNLKAKDGASALGSAFIDLPITQGTITLQPGEYYFAFTGSTTTARLVIQGGANVFQSCNDIVSATSSSGGVLPRTAKMPGDSWTQAGQTAYAGLR